MGFVCYFRFGRRAIAPLIDKTISRAVISRIKLIRSTTVVMIMKLTKRRRLAHVRGHGTLLVAGTLWTGAVLCGALAQDASSTARSADTPPALHPATATASVAESSGKQSAAAKTSIATNSPGIAEILKMAEAGVSKDVIKAYVERSSIAYDPSPEELIALKERRVPDEIVTVLLKRGAEVKAQISPANRPVAVPTIVRDLSTGGYLDPDSYDFWWYHYAYPRALSYSYRTLYPSYQWSGYYEPFPGAPYYSAFGPRYGFSRVHGSLWSSARSRTFQPGFRGAGLSRSTSRTSMPSRGYGGR